MTTVESLLSWETQKLKQLSDESGDVAKIINVFREFLATAANERQRFADERNVLSQQVKVADLNAEQRCTEMQNQIFELSNKLHVETERKEELLRSGADSGKELSKLKTKLDEFASDKTEQSSKLQQIESESTSLKLKLEDALRRLHYKEEEIKRINGDWESVSAKEADLSKMQAEARAKLSDVESREMSLKFREERLSQEKDIVTQQNTWLTDELTAKTTELGKLRQSSTEITCKLKSELAQKSEETAFLNESQKTLKGHSTKLEKKVSELTAKLQDKDAAHLTDIENIRIQLNKQERLTELYSNNCEEYQGKIKELTTAVTEMQSMLTRSQEENISLEQHCNDELTKHLSVTKELEGKIVSLQNELDNANDLILTSRKSDNEGSNQFDLSQLSSTAVTVGGMLKSGMSITQMYSAYVEATEQLALEKDKNRLQSQYLDQILKEIEEKAPLLQQQRADYENALLNQDNLADKLEKSMKQVEHYRIASEENQNTSRALKRENERMKSQVKDLGQQVQVLVREVEDARAGRRSRNSSRSQSPAVGSNNVTSSSQVISGQLVSFRSIAELQEQNQKLLCVVRELSEEQERREMEDEDPKIVELRAKLETAGDQIKDLKRAQEQQVEMVEAVARQRDMYRVLLAQAGHNIGPMEENKEKSKESDKSSKHELALEELQKEFTSYKKEKREQISLVQEQLDAARSECSAMLAEKTKLASKLEFSDEKHRLLETNTTNVTAEMKQYKEKCKEMQGAVTRLQLTNDRLLNENMSSREELNKLRHSIEGNNKTIELLKVSEIKQRAQNEALVRESRTQNMLLSNLQTIHNNLERQEFDRKNRTEKKIGSLESELSEARRKVQSTELRYRTSEAIQNSQLKELKTTLEKERSSLTESRAALEKLQSEQTALIAQNGELKTEVETLQFKLQQSSQGVHVESAPSDAETDDTIAVQATRLKDQAAKITELQHKVLEMTAKEDSLKSQVELAKQHAQQYKDISEAHEQALREMSQSEQSVKCASEQLMTQNWEEINTLTEKLNEANELKQNLQNQLDAYQQKGESEVRKLNSALTKTQHLLEEAREKEEAAIALELDIRAQFNKLSAQYEEAQSSISDQREEIERTGAQLTEIKQQTDKYQEQLSQLSSDKTSAESRFDEESKVWHTQKVSLEQERDSLKQRAEDLEQQNTCLHSQLATLSKDVVELQKAITNDSVDITAQTSDNKSTEELWEIIRYVRREKEILVTKMEVTESNAERFKNRSNFLEKQLDETRACLEEERTKNHSSVLSLEQHQELLKQVEESQALTEKIKQITEEKTRLTSMTGLLKQQIAAYDKQVKPLKAQNRELNDKITVLQSEKEGLGKDVARWSTRCNELIEQCNKVDAKEFARLQAENGKLWGQLKKRQEEHTAELAEKQETVTKLQEENGRVAGEKKQLLGTINSIKADGTKVRMELTNVSAELKTSTTQLENLKKEKQALTTELEEKKAQLEEQGEKKDTIISKLRALAKKYKVKSESLSEDLKAATEEGLMKKYESLTQEHEKLNKDHEEVQEKFRKAMEAFRTAKSKLDDITTKTKDLEQELSESNSNTEVLKTAMESEKADFEQQMQTLRALNSELNSRVEKSEQDKLTLSSTITDLQRTTERGSLRSVETNTDMITSDQFTNTGDTPTASVKPTASASVKPTALAGLTTPTAAVRPTSLAPDMPPRMATVTPTTSVHMSTPSSSALVIPNVSTGSIATTQVSSSSVQSGQGESSSSSRLDTEVTTGEVRAMLRSSPRVSSRGDEPSPRVSSRGDEPVSSAGYKRARCDIEEDDGEQPGPSTKVAMVTSSAHMQHNTDSTSEVSQSTGSDLCIVSAVSQSSSKQPLSKHPLGSLVSSSELDMAASSSFESIISDSAAVTSSEAGAAVERDLMTETNEATPAARGVAMTTGDDPNEDELMGEGHVTSHVTSQGHVTSQSDRDNDEVQIIEIASDSDGSTGDSSNDEEEDVYSGLEDLEEDSKQLQFSFVQSSGTDPVLDIMPDSDDHDALLEEVRQSEAPETTSSTVSTTSTSNPPTVRSLRANETPWAHLAASNAASPSTSDTTTQAASSSNVRSIRRIKRQPPKKE